MLVRSSHRARRRSSARRTSSTSSSGASASSTSTSSSPPSSRPRTRSRRRSASPPRGRPTSSQRARCRSSSSTSRRARSPDVVGPPLKDAKIPPDSKVASIIRDGGLILPRGVESIRVGDRIVVIGSPAAARAWSSLMTPGGGRRVEDVVIYGAGRAGLATARMLLGQGIGVRLVEPSASRARLVAEELPGARVYEATGLDPDFLERERIGRRGCRGVRDARRREEPLRRHARQAPRRRLHDRDRPRAGVVGRLRTRRRRRRHQSPAADGRGDRPLRARPPHAAGGDARGGPLRDPRHHHPPREPARGAVASATCR